MLEPDGVLEAVSVSVAVTEMLEDGVPDKEGVGTEDRVTEEVIDCVGLNVAVGVGVRVMLAVPLCIEVALAVTLCESVALAVTLGVRVAVAVAVRLCD